MADGGEAQALAPEPGYAAELLREWRPLLAAMIGLAFGFGFSPYIGAIMAPHLIHDFGWSRAQFAAVNGLLLIVVIGFPIAGRLADIIGVRRTALIGFIALPLSYLAFSTMKGDIGEYTLIWLVQVFFATTTGAAVITRVVVRNVTRARGVALAICASAPALAGAIAAPLLNTFVEEHGWRSGYVLAAAGTLVAGVIMLLLLPSSKSTRSNTALAPQGRRTWSDYKEMASNKTFWALIAAIACVNLPQSLGTIQLNLLLLENGVSTAQASVMLASLGVGTIVGRLVCGLALDRFPANIVSAVVMGLPIIGLVLFASPIDTHAILMAAVFLFGFSNGAEIDVIAYLIARKFGTNIYSSVFGVMTVALVSSASCGAILLSAVLARTDSFTPFLWGSAVLVSIGCILFLLQKMPKAHGEAAAAP